MLYIKLFRYVSNISFLFNKLVLVSQKERNWNRLRLVRIRAYSFRLLCRNFLSANEKFEEGENPNNSNFLRAGNFKAAAIAAAAYNATSIDKNNHSKSDTWMGFG